MEIKKLTFLVLVTLVYSLNKTSTGGISIPFKLFKHEITEDSPNTVFAALSKNNMYSLVDIGNPEKQLACFYTFDNETFDIFADTNTSYNVKKSTYSHSKSKSFKFISNNLNDINITMVEKYIAQDEVTIGDKKNDLTFSFTLDQEKKAPYRATFGMQLEQTGKKGERPNVISELVKLGFFDKVEYFSFNFTKQDEGFLNINIKPYEFNPDDFSEVNSATFAVGEMLDWQYHLTTTPREPWNVVMKTVFYYWGESKSYKEIDRKAIRYVDNYQGFLRPDYGFIKAPYEYKENIERHFFNKYLEKGECAGLIIKNEEFFYCDVKNKEDIKRDFPSLQIILADFNYIFILDFDDLFVEIGNNLYFLVSFDRIRVEVSDHVYISDWVLGAPFLNKYQFTYNIADRSVTFYRKKTEGKHIPVGVVYSTGRDSKTKMILVTIGILLGIVIGILIFHFLRKKTLAEEKTEKEQSFIRGKKRSMTFIRKKKLKLDSSFTLPDKQ